MTAKEMWKLYKGGDTTEQYEAWCYGFDPNTLAELTRTGVKTATASAYPLYAYENCDLPKVGGHNIILDTDENAVCITKTIDVQVVPFNEVTAEHAYNEGEGDRTLNSWREGHKIAFEKDLEDMGVEFTEDMLVVCETFEVVYPTK